MRKFCFPLIAGLFIFGCAAQDGQVKAVSDARVEEMTREQERLVKRMDELARVVMDLNDKLARQEKAALAEKKPEEPVPQPSAQVSQAQTAITEESVAAPTQAAPPATPTAVAPYDPTQPGKPAEASPVLPDQLKPVESPAPAAITAAAKGEDAPSVPAEAPEPVRPAPKAKEREIRLPSGDDAPAKLFRSAYDSFKNKHFGRAILDFEEFASSQPRHESAADAQFLVGESYFANGQYEQAMVEYNRVVERYPKAEAAPEALLKISECFEKLGQTERSGSFLKKLKERYPDSDAALRAK